MIFLPCFKSDTIATNIFNGIMPVSSQNDKIKKTANSAVEVVRRIGFSQKSSRHIILSFCFA